MRFQNLMASRYIFAQRRHSILTVCSIAAALTLMTILLTMFSTFMTCMRNYAYKDYPYHYRFARSYHAIEAPEQYPELTQAQIDRMEAVDGIESIEAVCNTQTESNDWYVLFEKGTRDVDQVMKAVCEAADVPYVQYESGAVFFDDSVGYDTETNAELMTYDLVGFDAWLLVAQNFALFYIFVIFLAMAMRLIIDTAFEISSKERERQFGMLQSIGATPKQIVSIITREGMLLSVIGIPLGVGCGIGLSYLVYRLVTRPSLMEVILKPEESVGILEFTVSPLMLLISALTGLVWVWLSAYGTGMRIIKMSPMQAISSRSNTVNKVKKHTLSGLLFGWKGTLASRNVRRAPKRFVITIVSLTVSLTLFAAFSYAIDGTLKAYQEYIQESGLDWDFDIALTLRDSPLDYREGYEQIEESGYFTNIKISLDKTAHYPLRDDPESSSIANICYLSEEEYNRLFEKQPAVSYEDLARQGGYILLKPDRITPEYANIAAYFDAQQIPVSINKKREITKNEYYTWIQDETIADRLTMWQDYNYATGERQEGYFINEPQEFIFDIAAVSDFASKDYDYMNDRMVLVATLSQYENADHMYYDFTLYQGSFTREEYVTCDLAEGADYREALQFVEEHPQTMSMSWDLYGENRMLRTILTIVKIVVGFINAIVAVIAVINMVNIISTGLLNRRSEIASMQCVGMTERQLYGMTLVECLQYVLTSGITATALCLLLVYATQAFLELMTLLEDYEGFISYTAPLPKLWLGVGAALVIAVVTTLITLHSMKSKTLVEQIQSVD